MRIEQITFTRFLAAILICILHFGLNVFPFNCECISDIFSRTNICVSYFFILSGFVMIIAYGHKPKINKFDYFKNRFARIYPVYIFALVLLLALVIIVYYTINTSELTVNIFVIQAWFPGKALTYNSAGWSLSVEMFFYLIFPFLFNSIYSKTNYTSLIFPILLIWLTTQIIFHWLLLSKFNDGTSSSHDLIYYFPIMHLNEFLIGNLAGLIYKEKLLQKKGNYDMPIIITILAIIIAIKYPFGVDYHNGFLSLLFVPLILLMSMNNGKISTFSRSKPLIFLGEISFGIYILQFPIFYWVGYLLANAHIYNETVKFYVSMAMLIIVAGIIYKTIETPIRIRLKKVVLKKISDENHKPNDLTEHLNR